MVEGRVGERGDVVCEVGERGEVNCGVGARGENDCGVGHIQLGEVVKQNACLCLSSHCNVAEGLSAGLGNAVGYVGCLQG